MKNIFLVGAAALVLLASCSRNEESVDHHEQHWDYENPNWGAQGYSECAGLVQSPIDIVRANTVKATLPDIGINYENFPVKIVDNGHTVQVNASKGKIQYRGEDYTLKQFHFHAKSEHKIDGQAKPVEVHFVHQNEKTKALIVLGVMVKGGGTHNAEFEKYLTAFPAQKNQEVTRTETINPAAMLPTNKKYYTYTGSLTTPPCSQGIHWVVFKDDVVVSDVQLQKFQKAYDHNARPVQPVGSRTVYESL